MANEFIVKNGLLVREAKTDGVGTPPSSSFGNNMFVPNIPNSSSIIPEYYLQIDSGSYPTVFEENKFSKVTGSLAFKVAYPNSQYIVVSTDNPSFNNRTVIGTSTFNFGSNQVGYLNNNLGSNSKATLRIYNSYVPYGVFNDSSATSPFMGLTHVETNANLTLTPAKVFYKSSCGDITAGSGATLISIINNTNCDGAIIEYTFKEQTGETPIRKTGRIIASWNRASSVSYTDVACPTTIGITGPECYFQLVNTSGSPGSVNINAYVTAASPSDVTVYISMKLFRTSLV